MTEIFELELRFFISRRPDADASFPMTDVRRVELLSASSEGAKRAATTIVSMN